jgi:hypothetical protein
MTLWRLNIKTAAKEGFDPRQYCISNKLAGIGWPVAGDDGIPPRDLRHYLELGKAAYADQGDNGWWPAINAIGNRIAEGE